MRQPTFSIITICYNAEQTIARTLRSVAEQTYPHIQHLVIDGASRDNTLALVRELNPKAEIYSEADKGIYDAMNKGLEKASGDYVWYLNAGDALPSPETISHLVEEISVLDAEPDIIYGDCLLIDESDRIIAPRKLRPPKELSWRSFRHGMLVCHQSFVAKRSLCPYYDLSYRFSSDVDWCIRVMKRAKTYHQIQTPLSLYLHEGATTANWYRSLWERFCVMTKHYGLFTTLYHHVLFLLRQ